MKFAAFSFAMVVTALAISASADTPLRIGHFNIRELDHAELDAKGNPQAKAAAQIIQKHAPDILSINEGEEEIGDRIPDVYTSPAMDGLAQINTLIEPDTSILDTPVGSLMCKNIVAASEDTSIRELSATLVTRRIHRLLIVKDSEVLGIVSVGDVLRAISEAS